MDEHGLSGVVGAARIINLAIGSHDASKNCATPRKPINNLPDPPVIDPAKGFLCEPHSNQVAALS